MNLYFKFDGEPKAVQSVRFARMGNFVRQYQPAEVTEWKNYIKIMARQQIPDGFTMMMDIVHVNLSFRFSPLKSWTKKQDLMFQSGEKMYKTSRPDLTDNLCKGLIDSLSGVIWKDDGQIASVKSEKVYAKEPCIILEVFEIRQRPLEVIELEKQVSSIISRMADDCNTLHK